MAVADVDPGYLNLRRGGELARRAEALDAMLARCRLCPRRCGVDRRRELGECRSPAEPVVASWGPHLGEEPPLSGTRGSGTVFLAGCNVRCVYCQNADISQRAGSAAGHATTVEALAEVMLELQRCGCHNINWVSPTHQLPALVRALALAADRGLVLPVVYNTNAYDAPEALALLDGVVDVYLPDLKYADAATGAALSAAPDYPRAARAAITEMRRQVGPRWRLGCDATLQRGLLVRLLVLPGGLAGVDDTVRWLASELSAEVAVSLMFQYRPAHRARQAAAFPALARPLRRDEAEAALAALARVNRSPHTLVQRLPA